MLADPLTIGEEFQKAWFAYFCRSGRRETNLEEFAHEVEGLVVCLLMWFIVKKVTVGGLDGWGWREFYGAACFLV